MAGTVFPQAATNALARPTEESMTSSLQPELPPRPLTCHEFTLWMTHFNHEFAATLSYIRETTAMAETEAKQLQQSLLLLKRRLIQPLSTDMREINSMLNMQRAVILGHLYKEMETPTCALVLTAPMPRILMKRRGFRYRLNSLRAQIVDSGGTPYCFLGPVTFRLRLFTSVLPIEEISNTRRGRTHIGALMLMGTASKTLKNCSEVEFQGVSFAEATHHLPMGTVSLVLCAVDTSKVEPLIIPGVRVRVTHHK